MLTVLYRNETIQELHYFRFIQNMNIFYTCTYQTNTNVIKPTRQDPPPLQSWWSVGSKASEVPGQPAFLLLLWFFFSQHFSYSFVQIVHPGDHVTLRLRPLPLLLLHCVLEHFNGFLESGPLVLPPFQVELQPLFCFLQGRVFIGTVDSQFQCHCFMFDSEALFSTEFFL